MEKIDFCLCRNFREKLRTRREAVLRISKRSFYASQEPVWWRPLAHWWWFEGANSREMRDVSDIAMTIHAGIEALALLDVLARLDVGTFMDEVDAIHAMDHPYTADLDSCRQVAPPAAHVGVTYSVYSEKDLVSIAEHMYGAMTKNTSQAFQDDAVWLRNEVGPGHLFAVRSVPVNMQVGWSKSLTDVLKHILHHVIQQQSERDTDAQSGESYPTRVRFEIVKVSMPSGPLHVDALPIVVQLQERGVYIPSLPAITGDDTSSAARLALTQSLRHLLVETHPSSLGIEDVCVSRDTQLPPYTTINRLGMFVEEAVVKLPPYTTINRLGMFVEEAVARNIPLRVLDLECSVTSNVTDIVRFFDVLSDPTHPLARHLEYFRVHLAAQEGVGVSWLRMLQRNHKLHTILVSVNYYCAPVDESITRLVLRVGPLEVASKIAFLSVLQDPTQGTPIVLTRA